MAFSAAPQPRDQTSREERAQEAQAFLNWPIFGEVVATVRRDIVERMLALPVGAPELALVHMEAKTLDKLLGTLRVVANDVKIRKQNHGTG